MQLTLHVVFMTKRYFVYIDHAIVGYVDATSFDNDHPMCKGALQRARTTFGHNVDVVLTERRMCNVSFVQVNKLTYRRVDYVLPVQVNANVQRRRESRDLKYDYINNIIN